MISKLVLLLTAAVIVAGAVGKWRKPGAAGGNAIEPARKCPDCGAYLIGSARCPCSDAAGG